MNQHNNFNQERPRNPNIAFSSDELKQRMAGSAIEQVTQSQEVPTEIADMSKDTVPISVAPREYTEAELAALRGSEARFLAQTRSKAWIQGNK